MEDQRRDSQNKFLELDKTPNKETSPHTDTSCWFKAVSIFNQSPDLLMPFELNSMNLEQQPQIQLTASLLCHINRPTVLVASISDPVHSNLF